MDEYFTHVFPGEETRLSKDVEELEVEQATVLVVEFLQEIYSLIQPLEVDMDVAYFTQDFWLFVDEKQPNYPCWYLRSSSACEGVLLESWLPDPQTSEVASISPEVVHTWAQNALSQPSRELDLALIWETIKISAVRARLLDPSFSGQSTLRLMTDDAGELVIPLEQEGDELWISGPLPGIGTQPPFSILFSQEHGTIIGNLDAHWSIWTERDSLEYAAFQSAISRLLEKGWKLIE